VLSGEFNSQPHIIIDIGGGSTELILGDSHEPRSLSSTKVGAVRLTAEYITTDPVSNAEFQYQAYVRGLLERPVEELRQLVSRTSAPSGGTSGTIAGDDPRARKLGIVPSPLTGYELSLKDLRELILRLRKLSYSERAEIPGMSDRRSEIILLGL